MEFKPLISLLHKLADSPNPALQEKAVSLNQQLGFDQEEQIVAPDLEKKHLEEAGNNEVTVEDQMLQQALPELDESKTDVSTFGKISVFKYLKQKQASAFIRDTTIKDLPDAVATEVSRFTGDVKERKVIEYGMVVSELIPKVDRHNFDQAIAHVKESLKSISRKKALDEFFTKAKSKCIILLNDKIIDGHHFLAKAKLLDITSSLKVIDLTPIRFQEKKASVSLLTAFKSNYVACNYSR